MVHYPLIHYPLKALIEYMVQYGTASVDSVNQSNRCVPCVLGSGCGCRSIRRSIALLLVADKQREAGCRAFPCSPTLAQSFGNIKTPK